MQSGVSSTWSPADNCPVFQHMAGTGTGTGGTDTRSFTLGKDGYGQDFTVYGDTSGTYMMWDASADSFLLIGDAAVFRQGTFASTASGSGVDLSDETRAMSIYSDDGGAAATGDLRGILSRLLVTANHTGALTLTAIRGQTKLASGIDFDADYAVGVDGYLEIASTSDFTLNSAGHAACAIRARVEVKGNVTVDTADTYLAGVYAELNTGSGVAVTQTNSFLPAFVATVTDQKADKWGQALFAKGEAVDMGVYIGEHANTVGSGLNMGTVTATNRFHADDGNAALTGDRRNILARTLVLANHTGALTLTGLRSQLKFQGGVDFDADYAVALEGYLEIASTTDFTLNAADHAACAVRARVEAKGNVTIDTADTFLAGVYAELNTGSGITITQTNSVAAAFVAIATDQKADNWGTVLYVDGADYFLKVKSGTAYEDAVKIADGVAGDTGSEGTVGFDALLKCDVGGTAYYIAMFDAGSVTGE